MPFRIIILHDMLKTEKLNPKTTMRLIQRVTVLYLIGEGTGVNRTKHLKMLNI